MLEAKSNISLANNTASQLLVANDLEHWNQMVSDVFCPMSCESRAEDFSGSIGLGRLDAIRLASIGGSELKVTRNRSHISQASSNYYLVKFQLNGRSTVEHRGNHAMLSPGDFIVCSSSDPYELNFPEPYRQAVLTVPQQQLDELVPDVSRRLGRTMRGEDPVNGMLSQFVFSLTQRYDQLPAKTLQRMEANVLDLLITAFESQDSPELINSEGTQRDHLNHIKQFIALHLQDTRLSPGFIAEAEGIGTRYLHMLFKNEQLSVSRYIQLKRLEACARMLANPLHLKVSTIDIAFQWGFNDVSHFHRCFKACFGVTPRQYRLDRLKK
jgi:AraC-like DNA-binding protein